jgi:hypothetical protein
MLLAVKLNAHLPNEFLLRFEEVDVLFFIVRKLFEQIFGHAIVELLLGHPV